MADALTIQEAAATTGWSPRMLRYIERIGVLQTDRSAGGYRLFGPEQLQRLRTLRELLTEYDIGLGDIAFALRLHRERPLADAVESWIESEPVRPEGVEAADWLRWEQEKHQRLLNIVTEKNAA